MQNTVTITLFVIPECRHCEAGRQFLRERRVSFVERDIQRDARAFCDLLFLCGRGEVPVLHAGYRASVGFDAEFWDEVLAHAREVAIEDPFRLPLSCGPDSHTL